LRLAEVPRLDARGAAEEEERQAGSQAAQDRGITQRPPPGSEASWRTVTPARLIDQLAERGFGTADDFVDVKLLADLRARCVELHQSGGLRPARVGRGEKAQAIPEVRGDMISWLQAPERDAEQRLLTRLDELRAALNRELMTGLEDFEGHFALYPRGAGYARHFDRLGGTDARAISAALYLNDRWTEEDGGQLRLYTGGGASVDVLPQGGRIVAFLSDRFEHEVLPARRERMSFTGWFRRRQLEGFV
jgi:SM-20-related protein